MTPALQEAAGGNQRRTSMPLPSLSLLRRRPAAGAGSLLLLVLALLQVAAGAAAGRALAQTPAPADPLANIVPQTLGARYQAWQNSTEEDLIHAYEADGELRLVGACVHWASAGAFGLRPRISPLPLPHPLWQCLSPVGEWAA